MVGDNVFDKDGFLTKHKKAVGLSAVGIAVVALVLALTGVFRSTDYGVTGPTTFGNISDNIAKNTTSLANNPDAWDTAKVGKTVYQGGNDDTSARPASDTRLYTASDLNLSDTEKAAMGLEKDSPIPTSGRVLLKTTWVDPNVITRDYTIDDYQADGNSTLDVIYGQNMGYIETFSTSDPNYVAAYASPNAKAGGDEVLQAIFAKPNDNGETLSGCAYDFDTGVALIPTKYFQENEGTIQMQLMVAHDIEKSADKTQAVDVSIINHGVAGVHAGTAAQQFPVTTTSTDIQIADAGTDIYEGLIDVRLNGSPSKYKGWTYDKDTGVLSLGTNPERLGSVKVEIAAANGVALAANVLQNIVADSGTAKSKTGYHLTLPDDGTIAAGNWSQYKAPLYHGSWNHYTAVTGNSKFNYWADDTWISQNVGGADFTNVRYESGHTPTEICYGGFELPIVDLIAWHPHETIDAFTVDTSNNIWLINTADNPNNGHVIVKGNRAKFSGIDDPNLGGALSYIVSLPYFAVNNGHAISGVAEGYKDTNVPNEPVFANAKWRNILKNLYVPEVNSAASPYGISSWKLGNTKYPEYRPDDAGSCSIAYQYALMAQHALDAHKDTESLTPLVAGNKAQNYHALNVPLACSHIAGPILVDGTGGAGIFDENTLTADRGDYVAPTYESLDNGRLAQGILRVLSVDRTHNTALLGLASSSIAAPTKDGSYAGQTGTGLIAVRLGYTLEISKTSTCNNINANNPNYHFKGIKYDVFTDAACTVPARFQDDPNETVTVTLDENGKGYVSGLHDGTYYVRENEASLAGTGFLYNNEVKSVTVNASHSTQTVNFADTPANDPIIIYKHDADINANGTTQGNASLAGTQFTITYYAGFYDNVSQLPAQHTRQWVIETDENGHYDMTSGLKVSGDDFYTDGEGNVTMPIGTVTVEETKAPDGYNLPSPKNVTLKQITQAMSEADVDVVYNMPDPVKRGSLKIAKASHDAIADRDEFLEQGDAELEATFTVYNRSAKPVYYKNAGGGRTKVEVNGEVCTLTAAYDASSKAWVATTAADALPYGSYEVKETTAPEGHDADGNWSYKFNITESGDVVDISSIDNAKKNTLMRGGVTVAKVEAEGLLADNTDIAYTQQGDTSLDGVEYTIYNRSEKPVRVDGEMHAVGEAVKTITTESVESDGVTRHIATTGEKALPFGTYEIKETKAADAHFLNEDWSQTFVIRAQGEMVDLTGTDKANANQIYRGDFEFLKKDENTERPMEKVAFEIKSDTTGEKHVVVSDVNGQVSTANDWNAHDDKTNANDAAVTWDENGKATVDSTKLDPTAGVWFSGYADATVPPNNERGALPHDTYTVTELRCDANEGKDLVDFKVTIYRDNKPIDLGTVDNRTPAITTELLTPAGTHTIDAEDGKVVLTDHVGFSALNHVKTYVLRTSLWDTTDEEAKVLVEDFETEFKPEADYGMVKIPINVDVSELNGRKVTAHQTLLRDGEVLAVEDDNTNAQQTVSVGTLGTPLITATRLTRLNTDSHDVPVDSFATEVTDRVSYDKLRSGVTYKLHTQLYKPDGSTYGEGVDTEFKPTAMNGSVSVNVPINTTELAVGDKLIAFEELYLGDELVASEKNLENTEQTVTITDPAAKIKATELTGADGTHEVYESGTVTDRVSYEGLQKGKTYQLKSTVVRATTGDVVSDEVTTEVVPQDANGDVSVEINLTLPDDVEDGEKFVAFETLSGEDIELATEADLNNADQTVTYTVVTTPLAPQSSKGGSTPAAAKVTYMPQTGGSVIAAVLLAVGALVVVAGIVLVVRSSKRR